MKAEKRVTGGRGKAGTKHQKTKPEMCKCAAEPQLVGKKGMGRARLLTTGEEKLRDLFLTW